MRAYLQEKGVAHEREAHMDEGRVLSLMPIQTGTEPGDVIALYPEDAHPFGLDFKKNIPAVMGSTTTTKTVSVIWGPDTDTDPEDSDS